MKACERKYNYQCTSEKLHDNKVIFDITEIKKG